MARRWSSGYGEIADNSGKTPDGDTRMRIGSITKVFAGAALASMVADGKVGFTDKLQDRLGWDVTIPERDGKSIRLIDLATHASGLPREAEDAPGEKVPTAERSKEDYVTSLTPDALLFAPGTGVLYSNFGFDLLAQALGNVAGEPYPKPAQETRARPGRPEGHGLRSVGGRRRAGPCKGIISTARPCPSLAPRR